MEGRDETGRMRREEEKRRKIERKEIVEGSPTSLSPCDYCGVHTSPSPSPSSSS